MLLTLWDSNWDWSRVAPPKHGLKGLSRPSLKDDPSKSVTIQLRTIKRKETKTKKSEVGAGLLLTRSVRRFVNSDNKKSKNGPT